jgi:hypothetical protein
MPSTRTQQLLADHLQRDKEHLGLLFSALEERCKDPDRYLSSYDEKQQEHIFKKLFKIAQQAYETVDTELKIMAILTANLEPYRDATSMHSVNKELDVDLEWKAIIFHDAAKLCRLVREVENNLLDGQIYKPPIPKKRPLMNL